MNIFRFAARMMWRDLRAGELGLLLLGLLVAVGSLATVGFFTERVRLAIAGQANHLLGADLVLVSDRPILRLFAEEARRRGLDTATTVRFPSKIGRAHV